MLDLSTSPYGRTFPASLCCLLSFGLSSTAALAQTSLVDSANPEPILEIDAGPTTARAPEAPATKAESEQADSDEQPASATPAIDDDVEITIVGTRVARTPGSAQVIKQAQ